MHRIQCPACAADYQLPEGSLGPEGRKVRCAACKTLWLALAVSQDTAAENPSRLRAEAIDALPEGEAGPVARSAGMPEIVAEPGDAAFHPPVMLEDHAPAQALPPVAPRRRPWHERMRVQRPVDRSGLRARIVAGCVLAACVTGMVGLRHRIVTAVPETAALYAAVGLPVNLRGLDLKAVKSGLMVEGASEMLLVQGEIVNVSKQRQVLPRLHFSVRDAKGVTIYSWTAQAEAKDIQPGQVLAFRRRLASPPTEGHDVLVRFASKADLVASAQ